MKIGFGFLLCLAGAVAGPAAMAQESRHAFRFHVGYIMPSGDYSVTFPADLEFPEETITAEFDKGFGFGIAYEYRVTDLLGVDIGLTYFQTDVDVRDVAAGFFDEFLSDEGSIMPLTIGAMFHVVRNDRFDLYLGPQVAWIQYGDVRIPGDEVDTEFEDEFTWGAKVGVTVPFGASQWALDAAVEYLAAQAEVDDTEETIELDPSPIIVTVGAKLRF